MDTPKREPTQTGAIHDALLRSNQHNARRGHRQAGLDSSRRDTPPHARPGAGGLDTCFACHDRTRPTCTEDADRRVRPPLRAQDIAHRLARGRACHHPMTATLTTTRVYPSWTAMAGRPGAPPEKIGRLKGPLDDARGKRPRYRQCGQHSCPRRPATRWDISILYRSNLDHN
jgi:hypothetical protein